MDHLLYGAEGAIFVGVVWFGVLWAKKGWSWGVAKLKAWWNAGKADLAALDTRLKAVEADVKHLKGGSTTVAAPAPSAATTVAASAAAPGAA